MKKFIGETHMGKVVSLYMGSNEDLSKESRQTLQAEIGGFAGDKHQGSTRVAWEGEWEPAGTVRRNERQWSGVSLEELAIISQRLELDAPLRASTLGANLCVEGISDFSLLPRGTKLLFPSGAVLIVEEYNPPCTDMGAQIIEKYSSQSGKPLNEQSWLRPASGRRGVVGVIDVPGEIRVGDTVEARVFESPDIRQL
jgi:hypothetical protein